MENQFVLPSKRRVDIVSVTADFTGGLLEGEVIESGELQVYVFAGVDPAPEDLIDGTMFVESPFLRHRIKLGVPGVIYQLVFRATLDTERVLEIQCRQAVLVDEMPVEPVFQQFYFTSTPYPIESVEGIFLQQSLEDAFFWMPPIEGVDLVFVPIEGTLRDLLIFYNNYPPEGVDVSFEPLEGELRDILIFYDEYPPEGVDISFEPRQGVIKDILLTYSNYPPEGVDISFQPRSGTLI